MSGRSYDVIVVGAGSVGTPAAYELAGSGLRVLVVDSAASVGQGASKAAIGGIRATHSDVAKIRTCLASLEVFSTWEERYGTSIEWRRGGYSFVAYREREETILRDLLQAQRAQGLRIDWLDGPELLEVMPDLNPSGLRGGTFSPDDGSASPLLATHEFYREAVDRGAEFRFRETVTAIDQSHGRVTGVTTDKGRYAAPVVIHAGGAAARRIAKLAGLDVAVQPDSHEAGITEPVARFLDPMIVDIRPVEGSANCYFYQHGTGQIIFCITPSPPIVGEDLRETSSFLPMIARRMVQLVPKLAAVKVRRTWRGLYPMTPDGSPIVGWAPDLPGFLYAVGMCGQGFMLGPGLAQIIARLVTGALRVEDREVLAAFSPEREFAGAELLK